MSLASITLDQILIMFLIIIIGIICYKVKLIDVATNKRLSNILLMLVTPLLIFVSYQREFSKELLNGLLISLLLAFITHVFGIVIAQILLRKRKNQNSNLKETILDEYGDLTIERISAIYSNCGFMGIPLVQGIFGSEGVFYLTAYITMFNIFLWTHGVIVMVGKQTPKAMIKTLLSPTIAAIIIGFIFFVAQIRIPSNALQSFQYIADMNTPLAMIIAGVTIGQTNVKKLFGKLRIYYVAFIKLLLIPIVLLFLYSRFSIPEAVLTTAILAAGCPTATTGTLFAIRYNKNALYASELFAIATLLSIITIPLVMVLAEFII